VIDFIALVYQEVERVWILKKLSQLILIEQTAFALPFAYLGILFAGRRHADNMDICFISTGSSTFGWDVL
jgi:hypothetical protein